MHRGRLFCCRLARLHSMVMTCDLAGGVSDEMIDDLLVGDWVQSDICLLLLLLTHALLTNIIIPIMLKLVALSLLLAALTALEVRIITNDLPILHGSSRVEEVNPLKLTINSNGKYIYPHHQNTFKLPQLPVGRSFVQVISTYHVYPLLMVDKKSTGENAINLVHPFTRNIIQRTGEPIYLKPIDRLQYLFEEPSFSISSFLFSGTGMFLLFGVGMYLCYSKLMPTLEEAQMAPESAQQQRRE